MSSESAQAPPPPTDAPPLLAGLARWLDTDLKAVTLVLILGALMLLPGLGTTGLWDCWEPHYAEVARSMLARDDLVHPYWESAYFFSKPVLPMWLMALSMSVFGVDIAPSDAPLSPLTEWAVRLPSALLALLKLWATFRIGKRLHSRLAGVIAAFILATSAQFIFLGKQATVDMPLVAFLTLALMHLLEGLLPSSRALEPSPPAPRSLRLATSFGLALAVLPQLAVLKTQLSAPSEHLALASVAAITIGLAFALLRAATTTTCHLVAFAIFLALAALSKGLAPFALLGPPVLIYAFIHRDPKLLLRLKIPLLTLVVLLVAAPWFTTMSLFGGLDDQEMTFTERFWLFDNFERASLGVIGDRGGFGYYLEQLAYATFPWLAFAPAALASAFRRPDATSRLLLTVAIWCFVFFTAMETKFHHYIFPILPPLSVLIALQLTSLPSKRSPFFWLALALTLLVARDLLGTPSHLVNLFVYKYDRPYPTAADGVHASPGLALVFIPGLALVLLALLRKKSITTIAAISTFIYAIWLSHCHFRELSPHWSQSHLFRTFYETRHPGEPIYSYKLNWRGETFYSRNTVIPVIWDESEARIRDLVDKPGRDFIITERTTFPDLEKALSDKARSRIHLIDETSHKYGLYLVED